MSSASVQNGVTIIDSPTSLLPLLHSIADLAVKPPSLYIDLEGITLGPHGSISIISIHISPTKTTYLIDIRTLKEAAFSTTTDSGTSLKTILESATIPKVIFDVRNNSAALFSLFGISLGGMTDLQLTELAFRTGSRNVMSNLAECVEKESSITAAAKTEWRDAEKRGRRLFAPENGYHIFYERPLQPELIQFCKQRIVLLPTLRSVYNAKLQYPGEAFWRVRVRELTKGRIKVSQSPDYSWNLESKPLGWDSETIEQEMDAWNEDIMMEARLGEMILNENDEWVAAPKDDFDEHFEDHLWDDPFDTSMEPAFDDYPDRAQDCMGYEEDMIKNGEWW